MPSLITPRTRGAVDLGPGYPAQLGPDWISPQCLDYLPLNDRLAVVRLAAELGCGLPPRKPALLVGSAQAVLRTPALGSVTHRVPRRRVGDELLWRVTFAVPLELVEYPQAIFGLVAAGYVPARLPDPRLATLAALSQPWPLGDRGNWAINAALLRRATALGTAMAVAGSTIAPPAVALAAGPAPVHAPRAVVLAPRHRPAASRTASSTPATPAPAAQPAKSTPSPAAGEPPNASSTTHSQPAQAPVSHAVTHARAVDKTDASHRHAAAGSGSSSAGGSHPQPSAPTAGGTRPSSESADSRLASHTAPNLKAHRDSARAAHHRLLHGSPANSGGTGLSTLSPTPPAGLGQTTSSQPSDTGNRSSHGHPAVVVSHGHPAVVVSHGHHGHKSATGGHGARSLHHHRHHAKTPHGGGSDRHPVSGGSGLPEPRKPHPTPVSSPPQSSPRTRDESEASVGGTSAGGTSYVSPSPSSNLFSGSIWTPWTGGDSIQLSVLKHLPGLFGSVNRPPKFLIKIYKQAARKYHIPWPILAAINSVETNYGRDLAVSPAGAVGWMQFMPSTWQQYGVAVGHSGAPNPFNPTDAIFAAARYLVANGGAKHLRRAIFAYNHAGWYVDEVLWRASVINALASGHPAHGFANPFPGGWIPNRLDLGYDGTFRHWIAAPFSGTITYAAQSFSNWGGYVEIRADHRIKGLPTRTLYFAEGVSPLFAAGTHVSAGTPIAKPAPSPYGDAYNTTGAGQGQIEWGMAAPGPTGAPTNPLAETGIADPARAVKSFAIWVVEHLGVAPPATTDHAGSA
jgi:hypothetical protein